MSTIKLSAREATGILYRRLGIHKLSEIILQSPLLARRYDLCLHEAFADHSFDVKYEPVYGTEGDLILTFETDEEAVLFKLKYL